VKVSLSIVDITSLIFCYFEYEVSFGGDSGDFYLILEQGLLTMTV
jgi:hypothetical protein